MTKRKTVRPADAEQTAVDVPAQEADTLGGDTPAAEPTEPDGETDATTDAQAAPDADDAATGTADGTEPGDDTDPAGEPTPADDDPGNGPGDDPRAAALANLVQNPEPTEPAAETNPVKETGTTRTFAPDGDLYLVAAARFVTSHHGRIATAYRGDRVTVDTSQRAVQRAITAGYLRPIE